jgi:hypothetical protein
VRTGQDGKWRLAWLLIRFDSRFMPTGFIFGVSLILQMHMGQWRLC